MNKHFARTRSSSRAVFLLLLGVGACHVNPFAGLGDDGSKKSSSNSGYGASYGTGAYGSGAYGTGAGSGSGAGTGTGGSTSTPTCESVMVTRFCAKPSKCGGTGTVSCGGNTTCPGNSTCTAGGCDCNDGYWSASCTTSEPCDGNCAGGTYGCFATSLSDTTPSCSETLSSASGMCECSNGATIPFACGTTSSCSSLCAKSGGSGGSSGSSGTGGTSGTSGTSGKGGSSGSTTTPDSCSTITVKKLCTPPSGCGTGVVKCGSTMTCPASSTCQTTGNECQCQSGYGAAVCSTGVLCSQTTCTGGTWGCYPLGFSNGSTPACTDVLSKVQADCKCKSGKIIAVPCGSTKSCDALCAAG